ncbi:fatty acid CoA ligase family protein [Desulfobulbus oligotrophicus]|jgi:acyl-CoA synthetase (AMP-forming)/AMP-acid ligase II|nr:fatty acid CoA ligase family protein [Desulfobulbus oligotrophicus]MDY0389555.1 fatty acid CoA ligase family protein [Desulfobulbus oligotrophicus]
MDFNIAGAFKNTAARLGDRTALVALEKKRWQQWSFTELSRNCDGFAAALAGQGVRQGDRVILMVRPSMAFFCLTFALFQLGAVVILIDPGMGYRNLLRCIGSVQPDILIGIPRAILFSRLFPRPFAGVRKRLSVGRSLFTAGITALQLTPQNRAVIAYQAEKDHLAAIIFTTGSTGPPKGVEYTHGIFHAQLRLIRDFYGIGTGDIDQPGFPLFGLFSTALGAQAVIPDMDPSRPAHVDPAKFVQTLMAHQVTYSFGSPAIWNVVSQYCSDRSIVLPVKKILMAGAPVSGELVARVQKIMPADGQIFTPYGATESLPVASIEGREIVSHTWPRTRAGKGVCVGRALPEVDLRIIKVMTGQIASWHEVQEVPINTVGEIVVRGPIVTRAYAFQEAATRLAKIADGTRFWHRMGDVGYLDEQQRLWFCGRLAHRVTTVHGVLDTIPCEAVFNRHPQVRRSALVGIGKPDQQVPVIVVEVTGKATGREQLFAELRELALGYPQTKYIEHFLIHRCFPVDIRHNAKIFREQLASWAAKRVEHE